MIFGGFGSAEFWAEKGGQRKGSLLHEDLLRFCRGYCYEVTLGHMTTNVGQKSTTSAISGHDPGPDVYSIATCQATP